MTTAPIAKIGTLLIYPLAQHSAILRQRMCHKPELRNRVNFPGQAPPPPIIILPGVPDHEGTHYLVKLVLFISSLCVVGKTGKAGRLSLVRNPNPVCVRYPRTEKIKAVSADE